MKIKDQFCSECHNRARVLYSMAVNTALGVYYKGQPICGRCLAEIRKRAYMELEATYKDRY